MQRSNGLVFWPVLLAVVATDVVTKRWAETTLIPQRWPHEVFGEWLRWTLVYNPGAAFGLSVGPLSRWVFMILTIAALVILGRLYIQTRAGDTTRTLALALVCAGAVGNLYDRIRHDKGVVDFIDVGINASRWPTFNVADMAVSFGAFLLAWVLWEEERQPVAVTSVPGGMSAERGELS